MWNKIPLGFILSLEKIIFFDGILNLMSLLADLRMVSKIENITDLELFKKALDHLGLYYDSMDARIFYVSKKMALVKKSIDVDGEKKDSLLFWRLLWYPDCCIRSFLDYGWISNEELYGYFEKLTNLHGRKNISRYLNLFEHKFIYHVPCSLDCQHSIKLAKNMEILSLALSRNQDARTDPEKYILCKNGEWIKFRNNIISHGSLHNTSHSIQERIESGYSLEIPKDRSVILLKKDSKEYMYEYIEFNYI